MLGWLMIAASVVIMFHVAEAEDRSPFLWAAITFVLCYGAAATIPLPFIDIFLGLVASFVSMFVLNAIRR